MNIDFDRLKYSLTGEYEEVMLEKQLKEKDQEIERLNNIIKEVREYIEKYNSISGYYYDNKTKRENDYLCCKEDILEILDKGE